MRASIPAQLVAIAAVVLASACASRGATPRPFPVPAPPRAPGSVPLPPSPPGVAAPLPGAVIRTALALSGAPYRDGGADPSGFDCSGFVWYVFARVGLELPRTVAELAVAGTPVNPNRPLPGDLLFFSTTARGPTHVGIAVGQGQFIHAPSSRGVVRVEPIGSPYWSARLVGARRIGR
jgi:cell wall-associated NlpC family hydrolase